MNHETRPDRVMQCIDTPLNCEACEYGTSARKCHEFTDSLAVLRPRRIWQCDNGTAWRRIG